MKLIQELLESMAIKYDSLLDALGHVLSVDEYRGLKFYSEKYTSVYNGMHEFFYAEDRADILVIADPKGLGDILLDNTQHERLTFVRKADNKNVMIMSNAQDEYYVAQRTYTNEEVVEQINTFFDHNPTNEDEYNAFVGRIDQTSESSHLHIDHAIEELLDSFHKASDKHLDYTSYTSVEHAWTDFRDNSNALVLSVHTGVNHDEQVITAVRLANKLFKVIKSSGEHEHNIQKLTYNVHELLNALEPYMFNNNYQALVGIR